MFSAKPTCLYRLKGWGLSFAVIRCFSAGDCPCKSVSAVTLAPSCPAPRLRWETQSRPIGEMSGELGGRRQNLCLRIQVLEFCCVV